MPVSWRRTEFGLGAPWSVHRLAFRAGGPVLPPLPLSVPVAFAEQAIEVGEIPVVVDEVPEAFAVGLARPFAGPWFAARIVRVEPDTPEGLPACRKLDSGKFNWVPTILYESPEISGHECAFDVRPPSSASYRGGRAGAQLTAQSERIRSWLVANRFQAISQASMMSVRLTNTELASQWLRR